MEIDQLTNTIWCVSILFATEQKEVWQNGMKRDCGAWINVLSHKVKKRLNARLADLGVNGMQSRVLHYILERTQEGSVFQKDLEEAFGLSRSTTTGMLQGLERDGLLRRESVPYDARLKRLVPTQRARELDGQVQACAREIEGLLCRGISLGQVQLFLETAAKMMENLDEAAQELRRDGPEQTDTQDLQRGPEREES